MLPWAFTPTSPFVVPAISCIISLFNCCWLKPSSSPAAQHSSSSMLLQPCAIQLPTGKLNQAYQDCLGSQSMKHKSGETPSNSARKDKTKPCIIVDLNLRWLSAVQHQIFVLWVGIKQTHLILNSVFQLVTTSKTCSTSRFITPLALCSVASTPGTNQTASKKCSPQ